MDYEDAKSCTPSDICESANNAVRDLLPEKSTKIYKSTYTDFTKWRSKKGTKSASERVLLAYFKEKSEKYKPSSLWAFYSMLELTLNVNENTNIKKYTQLSSFLKSVSRGFKSKKSRALSTQDVNKFIKEAPDEKYLVTKIALVLGIFGACRSQELADCKIQDVIRQGDIFIVQVPKTKTLKPRTFTINQEYANIVEKYISLRNREVKTDRFFLKFSNGKCTVQVVGRNKFSKMPQEIAKYLNLPNPELFTGHCFRRTSATLVADSGASMTTLKRHGGWKSNSVAEGYIEESIQNKKKIGDMIVNSINFNKSENQIEVNEPSSEISNISYANEDNSNENMHISFDYVDDLNKNTGNVVNNGESSNEVSNTSSCLNNTEVFTLPEFDGFNFHNCTVTIKYYRK